MDDGLDRIGLRTFSHLYGSMRAVLHTMVTSSVALMLIPLDT